MDDARFILLQIISGLCRNFARGALVRTDARRVSVMAGTWPVTCHWHFKHSIYVRTTILYTDYDYKLVPFTQTYSLRSRQWVRLCVRVFLWTLDLVTRWPTKLSESWPRRRTSYSRFEESISIVRDLWTVFRLRSPQQLFPIWSFLHGFFLLSSV